ncbi:MAG: IS21 family transposase [Proteobacteria bacterium]|nr:IS21 family transposase [Pseudomonadota bacterium]
MISPETRAEIMRLYHAEHFACNAIARHLRLHHLTVQNVVRCNVKTSLKEAPAAKLLDPFIPFINERLALYPRLRAPRLMQMLVDRGFTGSINTVRRGLRVLRTTRRRAFLPLTSFIGDEAQVDWASFGTIKIGRAERKLSCFVMVLSYSRAMYSVFCLDQTLESFLRSHVAAFRYFGGVARRLRYDNLKAAVIERHGSAVRFNKNLLEFAGHYRYEPSACNPYSGHEKGKVERSIRYIRDNFFSSRKFSSLEDANSQISKWLEDIANKRPWVDDKTKLIMQAWTEERDRLLPLPQNDFLVSDNRVVRSAKTPYIRYDLNDYSIPFALVHKPLTLVADSTSVKIIDGTNVVAEHLRSYSKGERITIRDHFAGLYERRPGAHTVASRQYLVQSIKGAEDFFTLMIDQGEILSTGTAKLNDLLHQYGEKILSKAIMQALERKIGSYAYVAKLCHQIDKSKTARPPIPVDLSSYPELKFLDVKQHDLNIYDNL